MSNLAATSTKTQIIKNLFEVLESGRMLPSSPQKDMLHSSPKAHNFGLET